MGSLAILVVLAGCKAGSGSRPVDQSGKPDHSVFASRSEKPTIEPGMSITGILGADTVEGGCAYLQTPDGKRYEVIYPKGWKLDKTRARLTNPDGEVVATAGDTVTVKGAIATDMASICQIGPIFRADQVVEVQPR